MPSTEKSLREIIWERRTELGLTQKDVCIAIGISPDSPYVGMVENGTRRFDLERLRDLAKILELPLHDLTELHFRERYNTEETSWLIELLFGAPQRFARKIAALDPKSSEALIVMLDVLIDKQSNSGSAKSAAKIDHIHEGSYDGKHVGKHTQHQVKEAMKVIAKNTIS